MKLSFVIPCYRSENTIDTVVQEIRETVAARPGTLTVGDFTTPVTVKYRGTYSFTFTGKRNYSLHLKDAAGNPRKASLLGLRRDDECGRIGGDEFAVLFFHDREETITRVIEQIRENVARSGYRISAGYV